MHPRPQYAHIRQLESSKEVQSSHVPHQSKRFWIRQLGGASPHGFLWFDWRAVDMGRGMVRRQRWHAFHVCLATSACAAPGAFISYGEIGRPRQPDGTVGVLARGVGPTNDYTLVEQGGSTMIMAG